MFCKQCGNILPERAKFCSSCGAPVEKEPEPQYTPPVYQQPVYQQPSYPQPYGQVEAYAHKPRPSVTFVEAIRLYFQNYANFSGRSRRSEYWFAVLFSGLLSAAVTVMLPDLASIVSLALICPNLSIAIRRLHDTGKSGWYYFVSFIPLVGGIWMLIQMCKDSEGENQWGPSPKY